LDGALQSIIYDSLGAVSALVPGQPIGVLAETEGLAKLLDFMVAVKQYGAAFDWELNVRLRGQIVTLHFAGVVSGQQILISGAHSRVNLWQLYDEMMGIANEQTNLVRNLTKATTLHPGAPTRLLANAERDDELYNETSRLNNELVTLQRELAKKTAELGRLNAQKNQFLGMASHDMRSPLNSILAYSEFLVESAAPRLTVEEMEYLELIISLSNLMRGVVDDLLDIAAIESGKLHLDLRPTDLAAIFGRTAAVFRPLAAKKQIHLVLEVISSPPKLLLDGHKIEQVLNNLLSNAIKFSHSHTVITLTLTHTGGEVLAAVKDEGQGIPVDEVSRLFQPFATTSVKATGGETSTGLGLVIARKIVEEHRGRIWVESRPGEGSTFHFALPLVPATHPPVSAAAQGAQRAPAAAPPAQQDQPFRTIWGAKGAWFPTVVVPLVEAEREKRATTEERAELASLVHRLADPSKPAPDASDEAKIVGLVLFLQQSRVDLGEKSYGLGDLAGFATERGERCAIERDAAKKDIPPVLVLERPGAEAVRFAGAGLGAQRVVAGAPVVIIHPHGAIAAVLGDVARVETR
jgi:signal transduction histidine kinase